MPSSERLPGYLELMLKSGRAVVLLADYRPPELADFSLTVIGLIDSVGFEGIFLSDDDDPSDEFVRFPLPGGVNGSVTEIHTDSADARAIHELWSLWHSGVRDDYLRFTRTIAIALSLARLDSALQDATVVGNEPAEPARQSRMPPKKPPAATQRKSQSTASGAAKRRGGK